MTGQLNADGDFYLLRLVPPVLRARGFRLYTAGKTKADGKCRLVDLWQNGGAAILGHTPPLQLRELKNTAERGLYAPFPHFLEERYRKALAGIFPGRYFRLYASPPPELPALMSAGVAALWRPFLSVKAPLNVADNAVLVPVLPGIQGWRVTPEHALPLGLCVLALTDNATPPLPPGDFLPPVLLAVAARGVHDMVATATGKPAPVFRRIAKVVRNEKSAWRQCGRYLLYDGVETWAAMFRRFLDAGFLLPPVPCQPVILPAELSPGEEAKLAQLLAAEFTGRGSNDRD